jgi:DNA-binding MarR family transcriptional regulator
MNLEEEIKSSKFESEMHKAHINILFSAAWIRSKISQFLKQHSLTHEQFNVLRILRGQSPESICMMDVASRMLDRNSNVTRIADKLLQKNWAVRQKSETDKREVRISITDEGLALLKKIDLLLQTQKVHQSNLTNTEAQLLNALLDKMRDTGGEEKKEDSKP